MEGVYRSPSEIIKLSSVTGYRLREGHRENKRDGEWPRLNPKAIIWSGIKDQFLLCDGSSTQTHISSIYDLPNCGLTTLKFGTVNRHRLSLSFTFSHGLHNWIPHNQPAISHMHSDPKFLALWPHCSITRCSIEYSVYIYSLRLPFGCGWWTLTYK